MAPAAGPSAWWRTSDLPPLLGEEISSWPDASGNGHDLEQYSGSPTLRPNAINGHPAPVFDGSNTLSDTAASDPRAGTAYELFFVAKPAVDLQRAAPMGSVDFSAAEAGLGWNTGPTDFLIAHGGSALGSFVTADPAGSPVLISARFTRPSSQLRINAVSLGSSPQPAVDASPSTLVLGGCPPIGFFWRGAIGEALVYSRALTVAERTATESYLNDGWDLAIPALTDPNASRPLTATTRARSATSILGARSALAATSQRSTSATTSTQPTGTTFPEET